MSTGNVFAHFGWLLVGSYNPYFRNLSDHPCTKPHHHVSVADHGGVQSCSVNKRDISISLSMEGRISLLSV